MDRTLGIFGALTLALILIAAVMVAPHGGQGSTGGADGAVSIAKGFITNDATYKFDGMQDTLKLEVTGVSPNMYEVTGGFTSAHGGYGDRTGQVVTEALTPHECKIVVSNGQVTSAMMDGTYDMIAQKFQN